jgi:IPT/TIG domain-containing protein
VTLGLVPAQIDALDPGMRSATVTFSYTPPGGSPTSRPLAVSLNLRLPKVGSVTPYVATSGTSREVILRGLGFNNASGSAVKFGSGPTVSNYTVASDTEIRVTHPSLAANSYRVSIANQLNLVRSTADLVVVDAPGYAATTIAYPNPTAKQALNIAYDAERKALLVGVAYPSAGQPGDIFRYTFSGSAWSATPASTPVSAFRDMALSLDGRKLIAVSALSINQLDPATLAAGTSTSAPFSSPLFLSGVALANDGNAVVTTGTPGSGSTNVYRYSVGAGSFSAPMGSLFSAVGGASADGSRAVFLQGGLSPPQNVFQYTASNSTLSAVSLPLAQVSRGPVLDRRATRIMLNGSLVYDANFQQQGKIPGSLAVVLSPNGSKAYAYSSGTLLHTYDLDGTLDMNGFFPEIATGTALAGEPGSNPVMTMSPDGGSLFIAGADAVVVVPAP